jgi:Flp pilus assembly pilin Flp
MLAGYLRDRTGHTAIEYSLIALVVSVGIIGAVMTMGQSVESMFSKVLPAFAASQ